MTLALLIGFMLVVLATLIWATFNSGAQAASAERGHAPVTAGTDGSARPRACESARRAVPFYRARTWAWQAKRDGDLADRTPLIHHRTCHWVQHALSEWQGRARAAHQNYLRWWQSVGQTVRRLDQGLAGSPMAGTGVSLEKAGREYHVSPYFMAAAAATESSLGAAGCGPGGYNAWGLANCAGIWSVPAFQSWADAYAYYARFLASRWPGHSTPYSFRGYAACDECWARKVAEWMHTLFGVPAVTRYP